MVPLNLLPANHNSLKHQLPKTIDNIVSLVDYLARVRHTHTHTHTPPTPPYITLTTITALPRLHHRQLADEHEHTHPRRPDDALSARASSVNGRPWALNLIDSGTFNQV